MLVQLVEHMSPSIARPVPTQDKTHKKWTYIHDSSGIRTYEPSARTARDTYLPEGKRQLGRPRNR